VKSDVSCIIARNQTILVHFFQSEGPRVVRGMNSHVASNSIITASRSRVVSRNVLRGNRARQDQGRDSNLGPPPQVDVKTAVSFALKRFIDGLSLVAIIDLGCRNLGAIAPLDLDRRSPMKTPMPPRF
jgi:hypothetical protein